MIEVFNCEQGSEEWYRVRLGIPTASEFSTVMAKGEGKIRKAYMLKLAGERLTEEPMEGFSNAAMDRGKRQEAEARALYSFLHDADLTQVGFIRNGEMGWSPDSLIGAKGGLEVKSNAAHIHIERLLRGSFPPEFRAQTQGGLLVSEREWIDLAVYCPKLPLFVKRSYRDELYLANLKGEIDRFNDELAEIVESVRRYGSIEAVAA